MSTAGAVLWVAAGGAIGASLRFLLQNGLNFAGHPWALGTLAANVLGSFLMGLVFPLAGGLPEIVRPFVIAGFLGAFTTMSSYSVEVVVLLQDKRYGMAAVYWASGAIACIAVCALGIWLSDKLFLNN